MKEQVAIEAVVANVVLAVGKLAVGAITHATSVFADGIHSTVDVISSAVSLIGIKAANKPSDKKHPYGHYKFEVLSGLIITTILFLTGLWILYDAYKSFIHPTNMKYEVVAIITMLVSALINAIVAARKISVGKKENSISLISDGVHSKLDVYSSLAILVGLILNIFWPYFNALFTALIGIYILKESIELGKEATDSLLDASAGEEVENKIKEIVKRHNIELADLKTQKKGSSITANLLIKLPKNLKVEDATRISKELREDLEKNINNLSYIAIQVEDSISTNYYCKKSLGLTNAYEWKGNGQGNAQRGIPPKYCVCPNCGYKVEHTPGVPCSSLTCPNCGTHLKREV